MPQTFPLIDAHGTHRDLGRRHGEQCRQQLRGFVDYLGAILKLSRAQIHARAMRFLPLFDRYCPHLVEEIEGLAEGAGVPLAEALAVQIRGELGPMGDGACTTFVISGQGTASGEILIGQNSDVDPLLDEFAYMLRLRPAGKPAVLMWTFGGQIGYHGMSSTGIAHFANSLSGGPAWKPGLPHYPVKRMMLEQTSMAGVLDVLQRAPVCSSGNYVLCDGAGEIADVELTAEGFSMLRDDGKGYLVHTNHFLCAPHACAASDAASLPDSFPRLERMHELVASRFGQLTAGDLQQILADHACGPTSICRHPHDGPDHPSVAASGKTVASLIAEPAKGLLHVARGNPCQTAFVTYNLLAG